MVARLERLREVRTLWRGSGELLATSLRHAPVMAEGAGQPLADSRQLALDDCAELQKEERPAEDKVRSAEAKTASALIAERANRVDRTASLTARDLLVRPDALLTRTHLRELGLERRAIDAVFRALPIVAIPGYSRPLIRAADYIDLIERNTFRDDCVRPMRRTS